MKHFSYPKNAFPQHFEMVNPPKRVLWTKPATFLAISAERDRKEMRDDVALKKTLSMSMVISHALVPHSGQTESTNAWFGSQSTKAALFFFFFTSKELPHNHCNG